MSGVTGALREFQAGKAHVAVYSTARQAGEAAASHAADLLEDAIREKGRARLIGATGNSQIPLADALLRQKIQWGAVELFHMDEYVGMKADHPASFRLWIKQRLTDKVHPRHAHYLAADDLNLEEEIERYSNLLAEAPIDLAFVGFGENGHIAFNDPPVADFNDAALVKVVTLDEACRRQQAGEGHFKSVDIVPCQAVTITCSGLFRAKSWVCCVPEERKAQAVKSALEGPISEACPASLVRRHPDAHVFLDRESASQLSDVEMRLESGT